jgi:hypothetical protein
MGLLGNFVFLMSFFISGAGSRLCEQRCRSFLLDAMFFAAVVLDVSIENSVFAEFVCRSWC